MSISILIERFERLRQFYHFIFVNQVHRDESHCGLLQFHFGTEVLQIFERVHLYCFIDNYFISVLCYPFMGQNLGGCDAF